MEEHFSEEFEEDEFMHEGDHDAIHEYHSRHAQVHTTLNIYPVHLFGRLVDCV